MVMSHILLLSLIPKSILVFSILLKAFDSNYHNQTSELQMFVSSIPNTIHFH